MQPQPSQPTKPPAAQVPARASDLPAPEVEAEVVQDYGPLAYLLDSRRFNHLQRIAMLMAHSSITPKHLRGGSVKETIANCFRVANQAIRWGMDPFSIQDETYLVGGRLGYSGKLVAAVINARAGLAERLKYEYSGSGDGRTVLVSGQLQGEATPRTITLSVKDVKTDNFMWQKHPDQKLAYNGAVHWARRHCPEIMLGVLTEDDLDLMAASGRRVAAAAQEPPARSRLPPAPEKEEENHQQEAIP